jgi:hypothetical protein
VCRDFALLIFYSTRKEGRSYLDDAKEDSLFYEEIYGRRNGEWGGRRG